MEEDLVIFFKCAIFVASNVKTAVGSGRESTLSVSAKERRNYYEYNEADSADRSL